MFFHLANYHNNFFLSKQQKVNAFLHSLPYILKAISVYEKKPLETGDFCV